MYFPIRRPRSSLHSRPLRPWRAVSALATGILLAGTTVACSTDSGTQAPFAQVEGDLQPITPPDAHVDSLPDSGSGSGRTSDASGPCDITDEILAACIPDVTALTAAGISRAVAATSDRTLWDIRPGYEPVPLMQTDSPTRQLMSSPTVEEDGQVHALLNDGSVHRLTLLPDGGVDWREVHGPGDYVAMIAGPGGPEQVSVNDPGVDFRAMCDTPAGAPPLASVFLDGKPTIVVLYGMMIEPLTGVDFDDSIGGCAASADEVVVAVPGAQRVVKIPLELEEEPDGFHGDGFWSVAGAPEVLVDGMYGHISTVTLVDAQGAREVWAGTENRVMAESGGGESDDRVVRIPDDGAAGGSPD